MGQGRIGTIMSRMAFKAKLVGRFTNHTVRHTMCTHLLRASVSPSLIAKLLGHKNIGSFSLYATASVEQQQKMSAILQGQSCDQTLPQISSCPSHPSLCHPYLGQTPQLSLTSNALAPVFSFKLTAYQLPAAF